MSQTDQFDLWTNHSDQNMVIEFIDPLNEQSQEWFIHNSYYFTLNCYKNTKEIKDKYQELHFYVYM